jgi:uncharacterized protein YciI
MAAKNTEVPSVNRVVILRLLVIIAFCTPELTAQETPAIQYDSTLAKSLGADERGMRNFVLVILKTGPTKVPAGEERTRMFAGHMANIQRLANEGKLAFAGPLDGVDGWRGMYIFATADIDSAKSYVATDPVILQGEMVAEYHKLYGSAGLMMMTDISRRISRESP